MPHFVSAAPSPAIASGKPYSYAARASLEPATHRFWFDATDLPQGRDFVIEVRARNCFGKGGEPLVSGVLKTVPPKR